MEKEVKKIKKQLLLLTLVFISCFIYCGAVSATPYADLQVSNTNCQVSDNGDTAQFRLTVTNNGPSSAQNVVLKDKMAGVDVSTSQYSINNGAWQDWNKNYINLGTLTAGTSLLIQFKADVTGTTLINKAEVTSSTRDLIRNNNYQSYTTPSQYTITSTAGAGGSINPNGNVNVYTGNSQSFTITPDTGMKIDDVLVDGTSIGAITNYTFNNVITNHTISATFSHITHTITATAGTGGSINPSGSVTVDEGSSQTFEFFPNSDYGFYDLVVDGASMGPMFNYTFTNIQENHTINVLFGENKILMWQIWTDSASGEMTPFIYLGVPTGYDSPTITITPAAGVTAQLLVDDTVIDTWIGPDIRTYTFYNVQTDHNIVAHFYFA
jgi:uncharacterized repeat protein (TIGR01451 family)